MGVSKNVGRHLREHNNQFSYHYYSFAGSSKVEDYLSVEGISAKLPCDITPPNQGEKVYLVLWYREDEGEPIYR